MLSIIITAHNEGEEVKLTCEDVLQNAGCPVEVIAVDDGSTDGSFDNLPKEVKIIRRPRKTGVASSRNLAVKEARGDYLMFLDAHQRVAKDTPARMADAAKRTNSLIVPGVGALYSARTHLNFGGYLEIKDKRLHSRWSRHTPKDRLEPVVSFVAPGWVISRVNFIRIGGWNLPLFNWGSTEVTIALKCLMCGIPVLADRDAVTWHRFRNRAPYRLTNHGIWQNAYVLAKTCFSEETYREYWEPLYKSAYWKGAFRAVLDSLVLQAEHDGFQLMKTRSDAETLGVIDYAPNDYQKIIDDRTARLALFKASPNQMRKELYWLSERIQAIRPKAVLEIGAQVAGWLFCVAGFLASGAKMLTVDISDRDKDVRDKVISELKRTHPFASALKADSRSPEAVRFVREYFNNQPIDVLHIDGGHRLDTVTRDFENYYPLVRKGGLIIFHDIVSRNTDVPKFWEQIKPQYKTEEIHVRNDKFGIGVIWK